MKLTCFCEKTARNDTRFFSLNRQRLWAFAALLALMPVILAACGGGGASSAEQAAQNLAKAFANNDTEAAFRMCQPSFRETLSAAEEEGWIDRYSPLVHFWALPGLRIAADVTPEMRGEVLGVDIGRDEDSARATLLLTIYVDGEYRDSSEPGVNLVREGGKWWGRCS